LLWQKEQYFVENILQDQAELSDTMEAWQRLFYLALMQVWYEWFVHEDKDTAQTAWQQAVGYVELFWYTVSHARSCGWELPKLSAKGVSLLLGVLSDT
jgi:hypothetical protein